METQLRTELTRYKVIALVLAALLVGYVAGQTTGVIHAQSGGVTKVQLDTSNCRVSSDDKFFNLFTSISESGRIGSGVSVFMDGSNKRVSYLTTVCR